MGDWYATRDAVKRAAGLQGVDIDTRVDHAIEAASRNIDLLTRRRFIPITETRLYRWPNRLSDGDVQWLDADLLSTAPTVKTKAQDSSPTTLGSSEYFLEPNTYGPPFDRIEINISKSASFEAGNTPQRSISVAGDWGHSQNIRSLAVLGASISAAGTSAKVNDASQVDVGHTLLVGSERLFVTEMRPVAITTTLSSALSINKNSITLKINSTTASLKAGEIIRIGTEEMRIVLASSVNPQVERGYNGTLLSTHANGSTVKARRKLDVERARNGSVAAAHTTGSTVKIYEPPFDIQKLCAAESISIFMQERSGWGREVGQGEGARELSGRGLVDLRKRVIESYKRTREAAI